VEIDHALSRVEDGSYGICEGLGTPIEQPRLEAIPWTRYSLEYAKKVEKGRTSHYSHQRPLDIDREDEYKAGESEEEVDTEDTEPDVPETEGEVIELPEDDGDDLDRDEGMNEKNFKE
jgi:hypothetical protein